VDAPKVSSPGLKRDLGTLESYAILIGILIGAGIFRVTSDATAATGPSVILAHMILAPVVLASAVAYMVFLSTPLGLLPGGEILHIEKTLNSRRLTFLSAWLKIISYLGAGAYLADALALNLIELLAPGWVHGAAATRVLALGMLLLFFLVHVVGVRWVGRLQVGMCLVLAASLAILIVPGLFAIQASNYRPFFTHGAAGFGAALPPLFFAYAGFESLAQAAGEVRDSRSRLPRVFVFGILGTSAIFLAMTLVAFGVLPASELGATGVPMTRAAETYLPFGAAAVVTLGAVMAVTTSLNATMLVPARLAWLMACEGHMPAPFARLHATARTPVFGLSVSLVIMAALLVSGHMGLALGIAVVALMLLYALHSFALVLLPRLNPKLYDEVTFRIPRWLQLAAAWISIVAMGILLALGFEGDLRRMTETELLPRLRDFDLTSLELLVVWVALGLLLFRWSARRPVA
jgi:APA family basic amino acid/polyamine antiporter